MLVFQNLQAKHTVQKIPFSKAAGQDNNIIEQRASQKVLSYLNVHLIATIVIIQGITCKVGGREYTLVSSPH